MNEEGSDSEQADRGVEMIIGVYLDVMQKVNYKKVTEDSPDFDQYKYMSFQQKCKICLSQFAEDDYLLKIPVCEHIFHEKCLKRWLVEW